MVALTKALALAPLLRPGTRLVKPSLRQCQLDTPDDIVRFAWKQINARRSNAGRVLDIGAGDGRFGKHGAYEQYLGYEIDAKRIPTFSTSTYRVINDDALNASGSWDVAVGNPPYIRNQDLRDAWRVRAVKVIEQEAGVEVDLRANLYVYFMWLALLRTHDTGLVAQVVPADWLVRPSARCLRKYIEDKKWRVTVYLFDDAKEFFPAVKTNLTLTVIDKRQRGDWRYFGVTNKLVAHPAKKRPGLVDTLKPFPQHARNRNGLRVGRGLSPGAQQVFVLTEEERKSLGIARTSVEPCVTSLRALPRTLNELTADTFDKHFVRAGRRCWLLKTEGSRLATPVRKWLRKAPESVRDNGTCGKREPWYAFKSPAAPDILYTSGFNAKPLFIVNKLGAKAVGSVHGVFGASDAHEVATRLRSVDYATARFRHARHLMKLEVSEMNALLDRLFTSSKSVGG